MVQQEPAALANGQKTLDTHMSVPQRAAAGGEQQAINGARSEHEPDAMDVDDARPPIGEREPVVGIREPNHLYESLPIAGPNEQLMREQSQGDR